MCTVHRLLLLTRHALLMLRLHYVPGGHGSPVCPTRSTPWDFSYFLFHLQVLLRLVKFFSRYIMVSVTGRWEKLAAESRRLKGALR